ncbi:uncharacterized protein LOC124898471 [Capsicum annuum]|uniref:uncharacterized protein LOC124898471 n=1 Tax=Capsicum annuum TaxID=4072 RepID=UPI001FB0680A|nr:uncharacterized protein LOC124898471 [Capsicum annuum]
MAITTRSGKILPFLSGGKSINDKVVVDGPEENNLVEFEKLDSSIDALEKVKEKEGEVVQKTIPRPLPPFLLRLKKKADDVKFSKFMAMLKQLTVNVPLVEVLEQMPGYVKLMKDLITKKRAKKTDSGAFTISCTIGTMEFAKALCDVRALINLMSLIVYRKLGLGNPIPTNMWLVMADRGKNIVEEVVDDEPEEGSLVKSKKLDNSDDATRKEKEKEKEKKPDPEAFIIPSIIGSMEFAKELCDLGASINLMSLAVYRKLGLGNPIPHQYATSDSGQVEALISILQRYQRAIGWTIIDIIGIPPGIYMHKIQLEEDCIPTIEHQRRLNTPMQEVVKKEIIKWLDAGVVYLISDSNWVSPFQCVPKKKGMTVVANDRNDLISLSLVIGWREKMTFTCPYDTFAFKRITFGLCNAPANFQWCMISIFSDMMEDTIELKIGNGMKKVADHLSRMEVKQAISD